MTGKVGEALFVTGQDDHLVPVGRFLDGPEETQHSGVVGKDQGIVEDHGRCTATVGQQAREGQPREHRDLFAGAITQAIQVLGGAIASQLAQTKGGIDLGVGAGKQ